MKTLNPFRKFLFVSILFISQVASAQAPLMFNYQAVATNGDELLSSQQVDIEFELLRGSAGGTVVWTETHNNVLTGENGLFTIQLGSSSDLSTVDWSADKYFLKVKMNTGSGMTELGTSQLLSVPYALHAGNVPDLQSLSLNGTNLQISNGQGVSLASFVDDKDADIGEFDVHGVDVNSDSALFEVKRADGQIVFAVYNSGVRMYVEEGADKGSARGGFAIGGFSPGMKGETNEYMRVTPDSVRIYLDDTPAKKSRGGFAIGGFSPGGKGYGQEYLRITDDSTRVYVNKSPETKGSARGGFAIGGFSPGGKTPNESYFDVSPVATAKTISGENRILWYPARNAFMTGRVLVESPDSVGYNSFASGYESQAMGDWSQALGFKAIARGDYSTAIGKNAIANNDNSFSFGEDAKALDQESYALGRGAEAAGYRSFAFGSAGVDTNDVSTGHTIAEGEYSFAIGQGAYAGSMGTFAIGLASQANEEFTTSIGYKSIASGRNAVAIHGIAAGAQSASLRGTANGSYAVSIGENAIADGYGSIALSGKSYGYNAFAAGRYAYASGSNSVALGGWKGYEFVPPSSQILRDRHSSAEGFGSIAMGCGMHALGSYSIAMGYGGDWPGSSMQEKTIGVAEGRNSVAIGSVYAKSYGSVVIGRNNQITGNPDSWADSDPLFVIGNGISSLMPHDAFRVLKNGGVRLYPKVTGYGIYMDFNQEGNSISTQGMYIDVDKTYNGSSYTYGIKSLATNDNGSYSTFGVYGNASGTSTGTKYGVYGFAGGSGIRYAVYASGDLVYTGNFFKTSDIKLKKNIKDMNSVLPKLMKIKPRSYDYKEDTKYKPMNLPKGKQFGMVAQELEGLFPELIAEGIHPGEINEETGESSEEIHYKGIKYLDMVPVLVKAVQEQQNIIESQQSQINKLNELVDKLLKASAK